MPQRTTATQAWTRNGTRFILFLRHNSSLLLFRYSSMAKEIRKKSTDSFAAAASSTCSFLFSCLVVFVYGINSFVVTFCIPGLSFMLLFFLFLSFSLHMQGMTCDYSDDNDDDVVAVVAVVDILSQNEYRFSSFQTIHG